MDDQNKSAFEVWFATSNISKAEKHIARAAWEAGRLSVAITRRTERKVDVGFDFYGPANLLSPQRSYKCVACGQCWDEGMEKVCQH